LRNIGKVKPALSEVAETFGFILRDNGKTMPTAWVALHEFVATKNGEFVMWHDHDLPSQSGRAKRFSSLRQS
jgi:hypothetical protein